MGNQRYHAHDEHNTEFHQAHSDVGMARDRVDHQGERAVQVEKWTYDFGRRRLVHIVHFVDGVAVEVTTDGYGSSGG
jgi:hypothetical protein